jgi:hypothetical protein
MLRARQQRRRDAKKISLGVLAEGLPTVGRQPKRDKNLFPNIYAKIPQIKRNKSAEFFLLKDLRKKKRISLEDARPRPQHSG